VETMIKQLAAMSTAMIITVLFAFAYLVATAVGADRAMAVLCSLVVCLAFVPTTWRFCLREAQNHNL